MNKLVDIWTIKQAVYVKKKIKKNVNQRQRKSPKIGSFNRW